MQSVISRVRETLNGSGLTSPKHCHARIAVVVLLLAEVTVSIPANATYIQTNLVSDIIMSGTTTDTHLVNPWGMAVSATSPFWVSDNGAGVATLYTGSGSAKSLVVTVPPPLGGGGASKPTGQVFNGNVTAFNGDSFIFATEGGTLSGWRNALGTSAELLVDNSSSGANYKGLAIGANGTGTYLFAANFTNGKIDIFDSSFAPTTLAGSFTDPTLPAGYAPFNIQNISGELYVTYALQDGTGQNDAPGAGRGYVDVFDTNGNMIKRLISGGPLNSPWGLALAPINFGQFSNELLVGNSGDGIINAFDVSTGNLLGTLEDAINNPISIDGLWALGFGNGSVNGGQTDELFFTAGPNDGANGLFGKITTTSVPEPATLDLFGIGIMALLWLQFRGSHLKGPGSK